MVNVATSERKSLSDRPTRESFTKQYGAEEQILGSTNLYENGQLRYVPVRYTLVCNFFRPVNTNIITDADSRP